MKSKDYLKRVLNGVFSLFPNEGRSTPLYLHHYRYLLILETALPYLTTNTSKPTTILDVGAGGGVTSLALRKMGCAVSAIDTWNEYSRIYDNPYGCKEDIIERLKNNGVHVRYCDIEKEPFPFEDRSFDIVLFLDVIEHLHSSPKRALKEINRVLKPNGALILTTPNLATLRNRLYVLFGHSNYHELSYWFTSQPFFGHVREYTVLEVKKMLTWTGFRVKLVKLSNCLLRAEIFELKRSRVILPFYLLITTLVPKFRYTMIVVGQKAY